MPDENRGKEVDKYGEADEKEAAPGYEQKQWEEKHTAAGTLRFGAKDAKEKNAVKEKQYDILLDDEIEFIQVLYAYISFWSCSLDDTIEHRTRPAKLFKRNKDK